MTGKAVTLEWSNDEQITSALEDYIQQCLKKFLSTVQLSTRGSGKFTLRS